MNLVVPVVIISVTCMAMATFHYWHREAIQRNDSRARRAFFIWLAQGVGGPLLLWTFFNCGLVVSPLIPSVAQAYVAGNWTSSFIRATSGALFIIISWWAAVTLAWVAWRMVKSSEEKRDVLPTAGLWLACALPISILISLAMGFAGLGFSVALCAGTCAHALLQTSPARVGPTYSKALAKIAFDKFNDAEWEIIKQLEEQGNDFDGWMLLAELYATHFKDLSSAERTVCELCDDPATTPPQISIALNRLADWHLKLDENPEHARWALDQICRRVPDSHMARMAQARMARLPTSREELIAERNGRTIRLKVSPDVPQIVDKGRAVIHADSAPKVCRVVPEAPPVPKVAAVQEATRLSDMLASNPDDAETRVKFARVMAETLGKADEGIEQLKLLARMRSSTDAQRQEWLTLESEWHLKLRQDVDEARAVLERITREFPQSHAAFEAQRRLYVLNLEATARQRRKSARAGEWHKI